MRSIDRAYQQARAKNAPFPWELGSYNVFGGIFLSRILNLKILICLIFFGEWLVNLRLWLQGDNCPKEVRNSFTGKWGCLLAQANYFVGVSHHHMVVGHTHEDIGSDSIKKTCCTMFWCFKVSSWLSLGIKLANSSFRTIPLALIRWCIFFGDGSTECWEWHRNPKGHSKDRIFDACWTW